MNTTHATLSTREQLEAVAKNMQERGITAQVVATKEEALKKITELIPAGASVMTGTSASLNQIGFTAALEKNEQGWENLNAKVWSENDEALRGDLRRQALAAEYFLAAPNAVSADGQLVFVDATGSRVSAVPFAAKNLILVVGAQKIAQNLEAAMQRIRDHVFPLENERAKEAYGFGSTFGKWVIVEREINPNRIKVVLVEEALGF